MSITKAFRKLSPEDREEAKTLMKDLMDQDGMEKEDAAKEAIDIMLRESADERERVMGQLKG
jgi:hypothetical protein